MPLYEYKCTKCDKKEEFILKYSESDTKQECPECHDKTMEKVAHACGGLDFKGLGCYKVEKWNR